METFGVRFGLLIRDKRGAEGLTQEALALLAFGDEARKSRVSEIESGKVANPQQKTVDALVVALAITPEELAECRAPAELPPLLLENLAMRFGHDNPDAPPEKLAEFLTAKAREFREMQGRLAAMAEADGRIANLVGAAETALAAGDFDAADARLADAEEMQQAEHTLVQVRKQAKLREERGSAALLKGDAARAAAHFEAAAGFFAPFDAAEGAVSRGDAANRLWEHGLRFGGAGLAAAIGLHRANLEVRTREAHPVDWARTQNNLGNALRNQGAREGGAEGARLLAEAAAAFRAAMEVRTRDAHPVQWAMTQNNLGVALYEQGMRTDGAEGARLLAEAAAAYRAALEVTTRDAHPVHWARTQNNLGNALADQGARVGGAEGARLLAEAVAAYRAAMEVRTRDAHPVQWAMTQNNLGEALREQGAREVGAEGARLLAEAAAAYRAAMEVRTRDAHPVQWAMTQAKLGLAFEDLADCQPGKAAAHLAAALEAAERALEVFDPEHMAFNHAKATRERERIAEKLAGLG